MSHSISNTYGSARVYLVIDQRRSDLSDVSTRRVLANLQDNLVQLDWNYSCSSGGFSQATAVAKIQRDTYLRRQLENRNYSTAFIYYAPPETEGAVLMSDYDSYEDEFLLWSGFVSSAETNPRSDQVTFQMIGLGDVNAGSASYTGFTLGNDTVEDVAESFGIAWANNSWIMATDGTANKVMSDGALDRKIYYNQNRAEVKTHIKNLAEYLGGHPRVAWGIRNKGGADDRGEFYFSMVADPEREQTSTDSEFANRTSPIIPQTEISSVSVTSDSSSVINYARVFKPLVDGDTVLIPDGVASNQGSIAKYGRRERIISDSGAEDESMLAETASAIVMSKSNVGAMVDVSLCHDPRPTNYTNLAGDRYLPLLHALKQGVTKLTVPFEETEIQDRADYGSCTLSVYEPATSEIVALKKDDTNGAVLGFDCRSGSASNSVPNAPTGNYSPCPIMYDGGDIDNSATFWNWQMKWTDSSQLGDGASALNTVALIEWDRQFYIALQAQGTTPQTYKPYLAYLNSSGTWTSAGAWTIGYGSTITKAQLAGGLNFVCTAYTLTSGNTDKAYKFALGVYLLSNSQDDPSGSRTLVWSGERDVSTPTTTGNMSTSGKRVLILNKMEGTGLSPLGASNYEQLGRDVEIMRVSAYSSLGEKDGSGNHSIAGFTVTNFLPKLPYRDAPFKYSKYQILDTTFGVNRAPTSDDSFDTNAKAVVWTSFINRGTSAVNTNGGFFAQAVSATAGTGMTTSSTNTHGKHNSWLIGRNDSGYGSVLGGSISIAPDQASCSWSGSKITINIQGNARPFSATYAINQNHEEISKLLADSKNLPN